jgi:hypothetical protein
MESGAGACPDFARYLSYMKNAISCTIVPCRPKSMVLLPKHAHPYIILRDQRSVPSLDISGPTVGGWGR